MFGRFSKQKINSVLGGRGTFDFVKAIRSLVITIIFKMRANMLIQPTFSVLIS